MYDSKIILSLLDLQIKILCSRISTIIKNKLNKRSYLGKILKLLPIHHCEERKHNKLGEKTLFTNKVTLFTYKKNIIFINMMPEAEYSE